MFRVDRNRYVVGAVCAKDNAGKIVVEEGKLLEDWKEHYDRISNKEFSWDREGLTDVRSVCGPGEKISEEEVETVIGKIRQRALECGGRYIEGCWRRGNEVDD